MSVALAVREPSELQIDQSDGFLLRIEEAKLKLREATDLGEIKEVMDVAATVQAYARAKASREAYLAAGEVRLWAERRAGEVRKAMPRSSGSNTKEWSREEAKRLREQGWSYAKIGKHFDVSPGSIQNAHKKEWRLLAADAPKMGEFNETFGISNTTAWKWEELATIPERRFVQLLREAVDNDALLSAAGLLRRDITNGRQRIEPGIYLLKDGRYEIRWKKDGIGRSKIINGDRTAARKVLARARGTIKENPRNAAKNIGDAYALVRRALQGLDQITPKLGPDAKRAAEAAIGHLHKAEDELIRAGNAAAIEGKK